MDTAEKSLRLSRGACANKLTLVFLMSLQLFAGQSAASTSEICNAGCICNDETLAVVCNDINLEVLPITLNPNIERLIVKNTSINNIDSSFSFYRNLIHLDLSRNRLVGIPCQGFLYQHKLQELFLQYNKISRLELDFFMGLFSLTVLNLKGNSLEKVSDGVFGYVPRLKKLNLSHNRISIIQSEAFNSLLDLRILYLNGNQLTSVPTPSFNPLSTLSELHIGLNAFASLPEETFLGLNSLRVLDLNGTGLLDINEKAFNGLSELRTLNLFHNKLSDIPKKQLSGLIKLEKLYIGQNDFLKGLQNIKYIDIAEALRQESGNGCF